MISKMLIIKTSDVMHKQKILAESASLLAPISNIKYTTINAKQAQIISNIRDKFFK